MSGTRLSGLELAEGWSKDDETRRARFSFPIHHLMGAQSSSVVYFEVDPGRHLGSHTDSAEEVLYVIEGEATAVVGDERLSLAAGEVALVPALVPHDVICAGDETVRVLGFFSSNTVVSVFEDPFEPIGRRVVGTPVPEEDAVAAAIEV